MNILYELIDNNKQVIGLICEDSAEHALEAAIESGLTDAVLARVARIDTLKDQFGAVFKIEN